MIPVTVRRAIFICACLVSAFAHADIIISDGPSSSPISTSSGRVLVSDGPAGGLKAHPNIITTDGPAVMAYQYPPKIVITDGPAQPFYAASLQPRHVVVSDGPSSTKTAKLKKKGIYKHLIIASAPTTNK